MTKKTTAEIFEWTKEKFLGTFPPELILAPLSVTSQGLWALAVFRQDGSIEIFDKKPAGRPFRTLFPKLLMWAKKLHSHFGTTWGNRNAVLKSTAGAVH